MKYIKYFESIYDDIKDNYDGVEDEILQYDIIYDSDGYYKHLFSPDVEDILRKYYKPGFKLLDIGCGVGNIMKLANHIGYQTTGIEVNKELKKYHNGLNVIYGDILKINTSFLKEFDIIYLYRPIRDLEKCNILFDKIYKNCKDTCKIIYLLPHDMSYNHLRKFNFLVDLQKVSPKSYTKYSVMEKIPNVPDIDIGEIIKNALSKIEKYRKNERTSSENVDLLYETRTTDFGFLELLKECLSVLNKNNIELYITYRLDNRNIRYSKGIIKNFNIDQFLNDINSYNAILRIFIRYKYKNGIYYIENGMGF